MEKSIDLILSALDAGAHAQSRQVPPTPFAQTAYEALKTRLEERLATDPRARLTLDHYLLKPYQTTYAQLQQALASEQIEREPAIIEAARHLLSQVPPQVAAVAPEHEEPPGSPPRLAETSKYTHVAGNIHGFNSGDYNQIIMNFRREPREG